MKIMDFKRGKSFAARGGIKNVGDWRLFETGPAATGVFSGRSKQNYEYSYKIFACVGK
jgi:hypothetical protein